MTININGQDIVDVTIDASVVNEITVDGEIVWQATEPGPDVIESFESGDLSAYSGEPSNWSIVESPTPQHGTYIAQPNQSFPPIYDLDHPNSPAPGDTWSAYVYTTNGSAADHGIYFHFGMQSSSEFYQIRCRGGNNTQLYEQTASGQNWLDGELFSFESNAWNRLDFTWDDGTLGGSSGDITIEGYDSNNNPIGSLSANSTLYGAGGIGFNADVATGESLYVDSLVMREDTSGGGGGGGGDGLHSNVSDLNLAFEDDFDQASFADNPHWKAGWGWGYGAPGSKVSRVDVPDTGHLNDHIAINNSKLILTADHDHFDTDGEIHVGAVHSNPDGYDAPSQGVTVEPPVYFEARMKLVAGDGWQNAYWTKPTNEDWPPEIDVMELLQSGDTSTHTSHNVHYSASETCGDSSTHQFYNGSHSGYEAGDYPYEAFHRYGFEWRNDVMRHYVDGQVVEEITDQTILNSLNNTGCLPHYLMLSLNLDNVGTTDKSVSWDGKQQEVDWVRVYDDSAGMTDSYAPSNYNLVAEDQFDQGSLDTSMWDIGFGWGMTSSNDDADVDASNVRFENNMMHLDVVHGGGGSTDVTQGAINSKDKMTMAPGTYVESRLSPIARNGVLPAFWSKPNNENWPPEIDFMEIFNNGDANDSNVANGNIHYTTSGVCDDSSTHTQAGPYSYDSGHDLSQNFHVYGCHWLQDEVKFYFDDVHVGTESRTEVMDSVNNANCNPFYIMYTNHVGRIGTPDYSQAWTETMSVDWFKLWEQP